MTTPFAAQLAALDELLARHAEAASGGDADALPALAREISNALAVLGRARPQHGLTQTDAVVLDRLMRQCNHTRTLLARREASVDASLRSLCAAAGRPDESAGLRTYGAQGHLSGTARRSRAYDRA